MGYTKLDENLVTSSLWSEDDKTLRVWVYLMSQAGPNGAVLATIPAIARACGYDVETVEGILQKLAGPDKYSRTPEMQGRRIVVMQEPEFAIYLVNHKKYRAKDHTAAARAKRYRHAKRHGVTRDVTPANGSVTVPNGGVTARTEAEAEANTSTEAAAPHPDRPDWPRLAADVYLRHHPKASVPGAVFRTLKPLVGRHGWPAVEAEMEAYLVRTPIDYHSWAKFAGGFGGWAKSPPPRGGPPTAGNAAVLDQWEREVVEGKRGA